MSMYFLAAIILLVCAVLAMNAARWFDLRYRFSENWTIAAISVAFVLTVFAVIVLISGGLEAMGWLE